MKLEPAERQALVANLRKHLKAFEFRKLFLELGWDKNPANRSFVVGGETFVLEGIAEKRGFQVFLCRPRSNGQPPTKDIRHKLQKLLEKQAFEHLVIYTDAAKTIANFSWPRREENKPVALLGPTYTKGQPGDRVIQKLIPLYIRIEDEGAEDIIRTRQRAREAFNRIDKITKSFYRRFKDEHTAFLDFIKGINDQADREWYASLMLNRLMFTYFIQKKGFLDGNHDYLRNRLSRCKELIGKNKFHSFYRSFLLTLFHEGLGGTERDPQLVSLIGQVPYLNGGLFDIHRLEADNPRIAIADSAFERLFEFFEGYDWHLDTRPNAPDNEINPDILGYIFEQFINQKQMGAYYTKEDITEYITRNTVLPRLFDMVREKCKIAFEGPHSVWRLLAEDPDEYIFPAVRHGLTWDWHRQEAREAPLELPEEIAAGLDDVTKRTGWNQRAPEEYGLPTETWREIVARRRRYQEVRAKLANGEVATIDDFITLNLNIRQFAQNVLQGTESTDLLDAFWQALTRISILDPTVGSGAFLFAALNILEPLYEAALDRMEEMLADYRRAHPGKSPAGKLKGFSEVLAQVEQHANARYYILKTIILGNLYGVDIMEEAVEICKLRFFLKLAAQVEPDASKPNFGLEPLPDLDFNVRAGNTLVGYATEEQAHTAINSDLTLMGDWDQIKEDAEVAARAFASFRQQQTEFGITAEQNRTAKQELQERLSVLRDRLDRVLAKEYGIDDPEGRPKKFAEWRKSHQPFHWYVEFYGILANAGFDVTVGNPPYVEYSKVRDTYRIHSLRSEKCGNIFAFILERIQNLIGERCFSGLIVPVSYASTDRMRPIRDISRSQRGWYGFFDMRPTSLFEGVAQRLCIVLARHGGEKPGCYTTQFHRWNSEARTSLIERLRYANQPREQNSDPIMKIGDDMELRILQQMGKGLLASLVDQNASPVYVHRICRYYIKAFPEAPYFRDPSRKVSKSSDYKPFAFGSKKKWMVLGVLNSTLFYWYWRLQGDGYHCGYNDVYQFPLVQVSEIDEELIKRAVKKLIASLLKNAVVKRIRTKAGEIEYQEFYPGVSRAELCELDTALLHALRLTPEEMDFILNYDARVRSCDAEEPSDVSTEDE